MMLICSQICCALDKKYKRYNQYDRSGLYSSFLSESKLATHTHTHLTAATFGRRSPQSMQRKKPIDPCIALIVSF